MNKSKLTISIIAATFFAAAAVQAATSVTATNVAPDPGTVIESYSDTSDGTMGPARSAAVNRSSGGAVL